MKCGVWFELCGIDLKDVWVFGGLEKGELWLGRLLVCVKRGSVKCKDVGELVVIWGVDVFFEIILRFLRGVVGEGCCFKV